MDTDEKTGSKFSVGKTKSRLWRKTGRVSKRKSVRDQDTPEDDDTKDAQQNSCNREGFEPTPLRRRIQRRRTALNLGEKREPHKKCRFYVEQQKAADKKENYRETGSFG